MDVGNRTIVHRDGTRSGDWRQALIKAPGIKRLPIEAGKKFYSKAGRLGQLRQVEKEGFVKDKVGGEEWSDGGVACEGRDKNKIYQHYTLTYLSITSGTVKTAFTLVCTWTQRLEDVFAATSCHYNGELHASCPVKTS